MQKVQKRWHPSWIFNRYRPEEIYLSWCKFFLMLNVKRLTLNLWEMSSTKYSLFTLSTEKSIGSLPRSASFWPAKLAFNPAERDCQLVRAQPVVTKNVLGDSRLML